MNSKGAYVDSCGIPAATVFVALELFLIATLCLRFLDYASFEKSCALIRASNKSWLLGYHGYHGFQRSINKPQAESPLSKAFFQFSSIFPRQC